MITISEDQLSLLLRKAYQRGCAATIKNAEQAFSNLKQDETLKEDLEDFLLSKAVSKWMKKPIKSKLQRIK